MTPEAKNHPLYMSMLVSRHKTAFTSLTQTIPTGPAGMEYASVEAMDGKSPMILKAIPKTSIIVKLRRNSCLYPSFAESRIRQLFLFSLID